MGKMTTQQKLDRARTDARRWKKRAEAAEHRIDTAVRRMRTAEKELTEASNRSQHWFELRKRANRAMRFWKKKYDELVEMVNVHKDRADGQIKAEMEKEKKEGI